MSTNTSGNNNNNNNNDNGHDNNISSSSSSSISSSSSSNKSINLLDMTKVTFINPLYDNDAVSEGAQDEQNDRMVNVLKGDSINHSRPSSAVSAPGRFSPSKPERYLEEQENRYTREMYLAMATNTVISSTLPIEPGNSRSNSVTSLGNLSELSGESAFAESDTSTILTSERAKVISSGGKEDTPTSRDELVDYSQLDRYGFIVVTPQDTTTNSPSILGGETLLLSTPNTEVERERKEQERRGLKEAKRAIKWVEMLKGMEMALDERYQWPRRVIKFESRLLKGVPECLRTKVWGLFLGFARPTTPLNYRELYLRISGFERQIDLDIERTLRDHILFKARFSSAQVSLFKILVAYSNYDSEVGYCQGMSTIAAFLLLYFEEEMAFSVLQRLMGEVRGLFTTGFPLLFETFYVQEELMRRYLPSIYARLEACHVTTSIYATKWYLTLFLGFPFPVATRIWDLFLFYGLDMLVCVALALLKLFQPQLLVKDYDNLMQFLSRLPETPLDENELIRSTWKIWRKLVPKESSSPGERNIFQTLRLRYGKLDLIERKRHHHRW